MSYKINLEGERFGKLTVISFSHTKNGHSMWRCRCECGTERIVRGADLRNGNTQSCGCQRAETIKAVCSTHGRAHTKLYHVWCTIRQRCYCISNNDYPNYGGRGIKVHSEWLKDFNSFYDYVSRLPHFGESGYSLDRINNDGNYEPDNVRWATHTEQANNRRKRRWKKKPQPIKEV